MSTYSQLLSLSIPELKVRLEEDHAKSEELRGFCKFLGLPQTGSKAVMVEKILDRVAAEDIIEKSPEGRAGREREIRPVVAAAALRAEASKSKDSDLEYDSFADMHLAPALPGTSAAFTGTPLRSTFAATSVRGQPILSPEILAAKVLVAELREQLTSTPPLEPSNADLMTVTLGMREQMALNADIEVAKLETVK